MGDILALSTYSSREEGAVKATSQPAGTGSADSGGRQLSAEERCALLLEIGRRSRGTLDLGQMFDRLLDAQVRLAREVQIGLLPRSAPNLPGWDIAGLCRPSLELGGDLYDHFPLAAGRRMEPGRAGRHGLVIGDVAGKGVPAALIMATFRALLRARRDPAGDTESGDPVGPAVTVAAVSRLLRESTATRAFVTCCYAVLDADSGEIAYSSCGHPPALLARSSGALAALEELDNCGPALGAFEHERFVERPVTLAPGDSLLLYTDGLTEALNPAGEPFGVERVRAAFAELAGRQEISALRLADELVRRIVDFVSSEQLADDLSLVVVRRLS